MKERALWVLIASCLLTACVDDVEKSKCCAHPVDPEATESVRSTLTLLHRLYDDSLTLFGHQDATVYGIGWRGDSDRSDVKSVAGEHPALYGWEVGHIELGDSCSLDSVYFSDMRREIIAADARGGINTMSWHLNNPYNGESSWDSTPGSVTAILEDAAVKQKFFTGLDYLADFFLSLRREDGGLVPILFRPFHEHSGSWFWWGADFCTVEEYVGLWRLTRDHLSEKGVHNLIYVYSPDRTNDYETYIERYPGDDMVDIFGLDTYHRGAEQGVADYLKSTVKTLTMLRLEASKRGKIVAFTETGSEGLPMERWFTEVLYPVVDAVNPAYVMVWRNAEERPTHHYAPYPGHPAAPDFVTFTKQENIFLQGDIMQYRNNK